MPTKLEEIIVQKIRADGPMNLAEYMELCLGHPEHGYYMTRDPLGVKGDFTTAPEISQLFGELIGAWIADTWMQMGAPENFILLECGPGRGTLMSDALRVTKNLKGFHDALNLHLLEMSPVLKEMQSATLGRYDATWHNDLSTVPHDIPIIVIGNEFLDALPVHQLVWREAGWVERFVGLSNNDTLSIVESKAVEEVTTALIPFLIPPNEGERVEVSLAQRDFLSDLLNIVLEQGGSTLFVDYGFIHNMAGDTLQAVKDHAYCNILSTPGEADITAHVNFSEISRVAMEKNMMVHGPVSQSDYLQRLGISIRGGLLRQNANEVQRCNLEAAVKRLIGTDTKQHEMGALFKVIAFSSDARINLAGFGTELL